MRDLEIKILTINTWKGEGAYQTRIKILAHQLKVLQPDILLCQECFSIHDSTISTLDFLGRELNMNVVFTPARSKKRNFNGVDVDSVSGLGIASSFPIHLIREVSLPYSEKDGERKVQLVGVELPCEKKMALINVHLTHLTRETDLRRAQINALAEAVHHLNGYDITIMGGDFNVEIDSSEIELLITLANVRDVFSMGGGNYPRKLKDDNNFQIQKPVDHLFILPNANGEYPVFSEPRVALDYTDEITGLYASDHPAIMTTLHYRA